MVVSLVVDEFGKPGNIKIKYSSLEADLDEAAVAAVAKWRFRPKREGWRAYPMRYEITLSGTQGQ